MHHFIKRLTTPQGILNVYFNRFYSADGIRWHVSAVGREGKTLVTLLYCNEETSNWEFVDPSTVPAGFQPLEGSFSDYIKSVTENSMQEEGLAE